jgi:hypothetical protein
MVDDLVVALDATGGYATREAARDIADRIVGGHYAHARRTITDKAPPARR